MTKKKSIARNESEAMTMIINIQAMQTKVYGKCFEYSDFSANTCDELFELQNSLIPEYNATFTKVN